MSTPQSAEHARTIADLASRLDTSASAWADRGDRLAYFAALYGLMTARVAEGIATGRFEDNARMERLACHFAARYFDAIERYERGDETPASWRVAFGAAPTWRPIILQHLMLGMNAHINYDLGIAAAEVAAADGIEAVQRDFMEINAVLAELLGDVQRRLGVVSPWMGILAALGGRTDEVIVNFSMSRARDAAWRFAERYATLEPEARVSAAHALDHGVARFAKVILRPGRLISLAAVPVRLRERASVQEVLEAFTAPGD